MTIRSKAWLGVAVSVAVTFGAAFVVLKAYVRRELMEQAHAAAEFTANNLKASLEGLSPDVTDTDLAIFLSNYMDGRRWRPLQRLQLLVEPEATEEPIRIDAPRGERAEITRLNYRIGEHIFTRQEVSENTYTVLLPVELAGPWKATLSIEWSLSEYERTVAQTKEYLLLFGATQLVVLILLVGLVIDRLVVRRLGRLGTAMRDVGSGDLERRVPVDAQDEIGQLSRGFNRMLEQLSNADREIRAFNERLAGEIDAATTDLSRKNLALAHTNQLLNDLRRENASKVRLATLGQLAAQLAHEIGTPLSSVSGHLQLAQLQRDLPPGLRERLEVATREIARIGKIVRDYLDSTRSLEPEKKETSLGRVITEALDVTRASDPARARDVRVSVEAEPDGFVTDPGLLRQIVINLLSNAFDAVDRGGQVALRAWTQGEDVLISVSDTGTGIAPEDLRRIFEPFYTTKGRGKGTGLGLAICRELVAALGGAIAVESATGQGSTFTLRLPLRPGQASESRPVATGGAE